MNGKGDRRRPIQISEKKLEDNWDRIFGRKKLKIEREPENGLATIRPAEHPVRPPSDYQRQEMLALVDEYDEVLIDMHGTRTMGAKWLRTLAEIQAKAAEQGKQARTVGLSEVLRKTAESLGLELVECRPAI